MNSIKILNIIMIIATGTSSAFGQSNETLTAEGISSICNKKEFISDSTQVPAAMKFTTLNNESLAILDQGFCNEYQKQKFLEKMEDQKKINPSPKPTWKLSFYASNSFTHYFSSDISIRSSRYNVDIKDYHWMERSSREFFLPKTWKEPGHNPMQIVDEPTNTFMLCLEKEKHQFCLSAFHPKFLQGSGPMERDMKGSIDGTPVDGTYPVNKPFDGYNQTPGECEIVSNQNTYRQMSFEVGYGYKFDLLTTKRGKISYIPSVGFGLMTGQNFSAVIKENEWWEFESKTDAYRVQGFGGSIRNRIEFSTPNDRFGVFYENKMALYHQHHGFLDGTQTYNIGLIGNSFGFKLGLDVGKKKKKN